MFYMLSFCTVPRFGDGSLDAFCVSQVSVQSAGVSAGVRTNEHC